MYVARTQRSTDRSLHPATNNGDPPSHTHLGLVGPGPCRRRQSNDGNQTMRAVLLAVLSILCADSKSVRSTFHQQVQISTWEAGRIEREGLRIRVVLNRAGA